MQEDVNRRVIQFFMMFLFGKKAMVQPHAMPVGKLGEFLQIIQAVMSVLQRDDDRA